MAEKAVKNSDMVSFLVNNIEKPLCIITQNDAEGDGDQVWDKSLSEMPMFTLREIQKHRVMCGKGKAIIKTSDRGRMFKNEGYVDTDDIFTKSCVDTFKVKGSCRASMKQVKRNMCVTLSKESGVVTDAKCNCPAGKSGYCNHLMALLFELADYSLNELKLVPEEVACTSKNRQWGVPSDKFKYPKAVMSTSLSRTGEDLDIKGITCTLYDPLKNSDENFQSRLQRLSEQIQEKDVRIGFGHVIDTELPISSTGFGNFSIGSALGYQLAPFEENFEILSSVKKSHNVCALSYDENSLLPLPQKIISYNHNVFPTNWGKLTYSEMIALNRIFPETLEACQDIEEKTVGQDKNNYWFEERKNRITSSQAHKVFIRKRNFESLVVSLRGKTNYPKFVQKALNHGKKFEKVAMQKFHDLMVYRLQKPVIIRSTGLVVQPYLFWVGASPDGLLLEDSGPALIEIKCPYSKRKLKPIEIVKDEKFYVGLKDGKPFLKKNHPFGYFTQVQIALGLSQIEKCYFIVYTFQGIILCEVFFDEEYFTEVMTKLNDFYRFYYLKSVIG